MSSTKLSHHSTLPDLIHTKTLLKGILLHCWWEHKLVQPLWRTVWKYLKKLKVELPYDPAIPLLGIYLEKMKTLIRKDTCTPMFAAALLTIAKMRKQPKCPSTDEWIKKMWYKYTVEYYSAVKKNEIMPFHTKWSKSEKDKYHMISLICETWKKMIQMNLFTKQK